MKALEEVERAEQERVRQWTNEIPLLNKYHPKALTCQDEFALDPLDPTSQNNNNKKKRKNASYDQVHLFAKAWIGCIF